MKITKIRKIPERKLEEVEHNVLHIQGDIYRDIKDMDTDNIKGAKSFVKILHMLGCDAIIRMSFGGHMLQIFFHEKPFQDSHHVVPRCRKN